MFCYNFVKHHPVSLKIGPYRTVLMVYVMWILEISIFLQKSKYGVCILFATIFKHIFPVEFDFWKMFSDMIIVAIEPNFLWSTRLFSRERHFETLTK